MKNAIYYDYGNGAADLIIEGLEKKGQYKFPIWIENEERFLAYCRNEKRTPIRMPDYDWFKLRDGDIANYTYTPLDRKLASKIYNEYFTEFTVQASREDIKAHMNTYIYKDRTPAYNLSFYSQHNIFYILLNFFYALIKKHNIELVYFNNILHDGADIVLFALAKELKIQVYVSQFNYLFPNRFLCLESRNIGDYKDCPTVSEPKPYTKNMGRVTPAYKMPFFDTECPPDSIDDYIRVQYLDIKPVKTLRPIRRYIKSLFSSPKKENSQKLVQQLQKIKEYIDFQRYIKNTLSMQEDEADFNKKFVFFPLHFQPEATTLAAGKKYFDQILAIEIVHDLIPDDWVIYVKDHYQVQRELMREESFWQRMKGLKKVRFLSKKVNTYTLIEESQFLLAITGTAGFEALLASNRVLVFGEAWYQHFTGVKIYHEDITLDEIMNCEVNLEKLSHDIGLCESKMHYGVIDSDLIPFAEDYNFDQDIKNRVESLARVFENYYKTSF